MQETVDKSIHIQNRERKERIMKQPNNGINEKFSRNLRSALFLVIRPLCLTPQKEHNIVIL